MSTAPAPSSRWEGGFRLWTTRTRISAARSGSPAAALLRNRRTIAATVWTREQIFLMLTAEGWREWVQALRIQLSALNDAEPETIAAALAQSLTARPLFCDLLAQAPMNLERNVSLEAAYTFKMAVLAEVDTLNTALRQQIRIPEPAAADVISTATGMAGALWQMAAPGTGLRTLYESHPELAHAVVDVEPRLTRILTALLTGMAPT